MDDRIVKQFRAKLRGIFSQSGPSDGYVTTIDGVVTYPDYINRDDSRWGGIRWSFYNPRYGTFTNQDTYYDYTSGNKNYQLIQSGGKSRRNRKGKKSKKRKSRKTMRRRR